MCVLPQRIGNNGKDKQEREVMHYLQNLGEAQ